MKPLITVITVLLFCLLVAGCEGDREPCQKALAEEYGSANVLILSDFKYIAREDGRIYYLEKMAAYSTRTTRQTDITDFINQSLIEGQTGIERKLLMAKNFDVVSSFLQHSVEQGAISTDGKELRSYGIVIARWNRDEILMPNSSVFHSVTTTKHRNLVRSMALEKGINVKEVN